MPMPAADITRPTPFGASSATATTWPRAFSPIENERTTNAPQVSPPVNIAPSDHDFARVGRAPFVWTVMVAQTDDPTVTCWPLPPIVALRIVFPASPPADEALVRPPGDGLAPGPRDLVPLGRAVGGGRERLRRRTPRGVPTTGSAAARTRPGT